MATKISVRYVEDPKIRTLRIRTWYSAVALASGMTPRELELQFADRSPERPVSPRSCIWDKYRRGEVEPRSGLKRSGKQSLVERVEERYPGTSQWLSSPLWRLADRAPMPMDEIRQVFEQMPALIRDIFIVQPKPDKDQFWRRPVDEEHACEILRRMANADAFVATLAMVKEAEITQDQFQHYVAVEAAKMYLASMANHPVLGTAMRSGLPRYLASRWHAVRYFDVDEWFPWRSTQLLD